MLYRSQAGGAPAPAPSSDYLAPLRGAAYSLTLLAGLTLPAAAAEKAERPSAGANAAGQAEEPAIIFARLDAALSAEQSAPAAAQIARITPHVQQYRDALRQAPAVSREELERASRLAISRLNITHFSSNVEREPCVAFFKEQVFPLYRVLLEKCSSTEGCSEIAAALRHDILWSAAHRPKDARGEFGPLIWDVAADAYQAACIDPTIFEDAHICASRLNYYASHNSITMRLLLLNREPIDALLNRSLASIDAAPWSHDEEDLNGLLALRRQIREAGLSPHEAYCLDAGQTKQLRDWLRSEAFSIDTPRFISLVAAALKSAFRAEDSSQETKIDEELKQIGRSETLLNAYLSRLAQYLDTRTLPPAARAALYQSLIRTELVERHGELGAAWLRSRLMKEQDPCVLYEGLGQCIGALSIAELTKAGEKGRSCLPLLSQLAAERRADSSALTAAPPLFVLAYDVLDNAASGYRYHRFLAAPPPDRDALLQQITALRRSCLGTSFGILHALDLAGQRHGCGSDQADDCAVFFSEMRQAGDQLSARLARFEGYGLSEEGLAAGIAASLARAGDRFSLKAEADAFYAAKKEELRLALTFGLTDTPSPFSQAYRNIRMFLYSQVFGNFPEYVPPSPRAEELDRLAREAVTLERTVIAYRTAMLLLAGSADSRPIATHRYLSSSAMQRECVQTLEDLGLMSNAEVRYELQRVPAGELAARLRVLVEETEKKRAASAKAIWAHHPDFKTRMAAGATGSATK